MVLFTLSSGEVHVYDSEGNFMSKMNLERWPKFDSGDDNEPIVAVRWKTAKTCSEMETPTLAVIWRASCMTLTRGVNDENPIIVDTRLVATCGDWSPNGMYVAVGGQPTLIGQTKQASDFDHINIFDQMGKLLHHIKIPGSPVTSLSWDYLSLRLAIGAGAHVYFANLRPQYRYAYFGCNTVAYAFIRPDGSNHIGFWDTKKLTTQEIPGQILDVQGDEDYFAILSVNGTGAYNVSVLNAVGAPVDGLSIMTIEPFAISLTQSVLVCLAPNAVLLWKYQLATSQSLVVSDMSSKRRERTFHIDENPKLLENTDFNDRDSTGQDLTAQRTKDPAICCDARLDLLVVARDSGRLQLYSLPHGALLSVLDIAVEMGIRPQSIFLNSDALQLAMLDNGGHLSICSLSTTTLKTSSIRKYDRKDIWNLIWARDNPSLLCIMEKTRLYVMKNGEVEEPVISSGYLAYFKGLEVTVILLDEIMQASENLKPEYSMKLETRALRDIKSLIDNGTDLLDVGRYVEENSHPSLWRLLARAALNQLDLSVAETAFVRCRDYAGVQFSKRIANITNDVVRKAEVSCFFEDFEKAEALFLEADRRDLAGDMWKLLGEWNKVDQVSQPLAKQRPSDKTFREMNIALGDTAGEDQEWDKALTYYEKAEDTSRLVECYLMMEDYGNLEKLISTLPEKSFLLIRIAAAFEAVGLTTEAVKAYLAANMPEKAVEAAVVLSQWNLAMELAQRHTLHNVAPVLLRYTGHLLENGETMQAVELLRKSDKPFAAGKLLAMLAIRFLNSEENVSLGLIKKLFVMSAQMFTYKTRKFFREKSVGAPKSAKSDTGSNYGDEDDADLSFESHIPEDFRPSPEEYRWMREMPWRGAEAVHFLCLVQRFIYQAQYGNATKAALYLRNFVDVLGDERVNTLLALAAANNKCYNICSRAFIHLELLDEDYSDVTSDLFSEHPPKDIRIQKLECPGCTTMIADNATTCISCNAKFPVCSATGRPIHDSSKVWTCEVCTKVTDIKEIAQRRHCPLCHTVKKNTGE
ncbi:unnamed protein product [Orchesella dallaii]